ncbi:U6 snRNA-associated Sm-like protein LSm6 [Cryptococcus neoformans]|nr:U6 snRNA-associated Sm-like protein LSm6 [Cryptococcus neoformans var. grubii Bt1]OWZ66585.1 U6 snRNA-associated Sm-like protein LSm6 [Cryptococcus neoformans var. grubii]OWZ74949.1 U6 snRNA-associated Sm-like protein LSm6 [Cryptococcus neoformans var. grubii Bt85]OXG11056.1 U6 snRNA-associated Sm-like protein LSm6 [Cryptococcus neoformans var. grubii Tu401-1]OXG11690.1 U6 snRNA-associated Sm-like protein LSm6 [Cryptococcus neoformans var. grubii Ze90-1]OXM75992.1 U6 snRNA-associated Sm-lik
MSSPESQGEPQPVSGSPSEFLRNIVGKRVKVRIGSGVDYTGLLTCLDGYMNVALEQAEEWAGEVKTAAYGDCFLRGNNVLYISALEDL